MDFQNNFDDSGLELEFSGQKKNDSEGGTTSFLASGSKPPQKRKESSGHRAISDSEEQELVEWIETKNKAGEFPTRGEVIQKATEIIKRRDRFRSQVSRSWAADFQRRHPELQLSVKGSTLKEKTINTYFTDAEEKEIYQWIKHQNEKNLFPSQHQVRNYAVQVAQKRDPNKKSFSRNWFIRFQRQYPDLKFAVLDDKAKFQMLEAEEKEIYKWVKQERDKGNVVTNQEILQYATQLLQKKDPNFDMPTSVPEKWYDKFNDPKKRLLEDSPQLSEKKLKSQE